jgi:hypothetical protein
MKFSSDINSPVSEADFFPKLRLYVPTRRHEAGGDKLSADVAFA